MNADTDHFYLTPEAAKAGDMVPVQVEIGIPDGSRKVIHMMITQDQYDQMMRKSRQDVSCGSSGPQGG